MQTSYICIIYMYNIYCLISIHSGQRIQQCYAIFKMAGTLNKGAILWMHCIIVQGFNIGSGIGMEDGICRSFFYYKNRTSSNQTGKMLARRLPGSGLVFIKAKYSKFMANPRFTFYNNVAFSLTQGRGAQFSYFHAVAVVKSRLFSQKISLDIAILVLVPIL